MFLQQPHEYMSLIGVPSVAELLPLADTINQNARRTRVSVRVEPQFRIRQGKHITVWPNSSLIVQQMRPHPKLHYEVVFGLIAAKDNPHTLASVIKGYASSIYGIVWKGRPDLGFIHDLSLHYPQINQTIRLDPSELNLGNSRQLKRKLDAWQLCGVNELLIPVQHLDNHNFRAWRQSLEVIIKHGRLAIRLEQASAARIDLMRRLILARGHTRYGIEVEYHTIKPLIEKRHQRQLILDQEGIVQ